MPQLSTVLDQESSEVSINDEAIAIVEQRVESSNHEPTGHSSTKKQSL